MRMRIKAIKEQKEKREKENKASKMEQALYKLAELGIEVSKARKPLKQCLKQKTII